ncbi:hypothetical protein Syn7502_00548 [Synechococcus sp. PCC 7502]|uniref:hypothetical protein n=1 Tax=Synechococcus sp. PCC 7502 TaxID=1173263 RepID=UPI00029FD5C8|nr:hypothetical protein [Synechococcus sp. PCC 7502]AFY72703.1 hypothetical protein Syn7502_00548 [Synechococcus sp. PCC 7502]
MGEIDKPIANTSSNPDANKVSKFGTAITLILVITISAISGVVVILLAIAFAFSIVSFTEAKDIFSLILVTLGSLTGSALGFYFGTLAAKEPKN